jgi:hypothetical protein
VTLAPAAPAQACLLGRSAAASLDGLLAARRGHAQAARREKRCTATASLPGCGAHGLSAARLLRVPALVRIRNEHRRVMSAGTLCVPARGAHTDRHTRKSLTVALPPTHPFSLSLPDQGVEGRAQGRVRGRCARWHPHGREAGG